jgi:hypothetical protein
MTTTHGSPAGVNRVTSPRWRRAGPLVVALAAVAALTAACAGEGSSASSNSTSAQLSARQSGLFFDSCIRAHGFPDFPDSAVSVIGGQLEIHVPINLKGDPQLQSAFQACQTDLPGGGLDLQKKHVSIQGELEYAECMRSHGIADFPDPMPGGGFTITFSTNTPQFEAADHSCGAKVSK